MDDIKKLYIVDSLDNVATALGSLALGEVPLFGASGAGLLTITSALERGHKAALRDIKAGESIIKYGAAIGTATEDIKKGDWVHIHNIKSAYDTRSAAGIDAHTGKAVDTRYE